MTIDVNIEHTDLDIPDEPEDDGEGITSVFLTIFTADGMRYSANVSCDGDPAVEQLADMVTKTVKAVATAHSTDLPRHLGCVRYNPPLPPR